MAAKKKTTKQKSVETITHEEEKRKNIPTVEHRSFIHENLKTPITIAYQRRNPDLDPQLIWKGKDPAEDPDLVVQVPPLYIQEKIHPRILIQDLLQKSEDTKKSKDAQPDLFGDFNGIPKDADKTEFYQHDQNWTNRMILGDSLQVMASLAERESLRGKVQCIYFDPPYGIKFNSNFQWSTTSRDVKDGKANHITREPEQVKAFRDTWKEGIHSYLTYLRDRLIVARDLLTDSGSIFVQIGDENAHRVRAIMDEVFGEENFVRIINFKTTSGFKTNFLSKTSDFILWYGKSIKSLKYNQLYFEKDIANDNISVYKMLRLEDGKVRKITDEEKINQALIPLNSEIYRLDNITSQGSNSFDVQYFGKNFSLKNNLIWKTHELGMKKLIKSERVSISGKGLAYNRRLSDFSINRINEIWTDTITGSFTENKIYVVQTNTKVIERCILMSTDPGDLVLDPTCGSGTTPTVAEQWGRRWITIDTSRVALALTRARIMGARYPYYYLADSPEGKEKEAEVTRNAVSTAPTYGNIKHGFVYERVPHITLKSIANNTEIDVIWDKWEPKVSKSLQGINTALRGHKKAYKSPTGGREGKEIRFDAKEGESITLPSGDKALVYEFFDWEVPREKPEDWPKAVEKPLAEYWKARIERQKEMDASIASKADTEYLYDKPYENKSVVRVAGPFTVESLTPHRMAEEEGDTSKSREQDDFLKVILDNLRSAGVQHAHKEDKIAFESLVPWPGDLVCAEGKYTSTEGKEIRAGIFVGPEYGTVTRPDLVEAAREASDAGFQVLIACAFNFEAQTTEFDKLGRVPVLKARMNADLHMAEDLRNNGKGNLFVVFGEPDIEIITEGSDIRVKILGVDVFDPNTGQVRSDGPEGIACWFVDTDYNEESFFVRHAYFLGSGDPYKSLKTSLKAEIDPEAWESLNSDISRPFAKPKSKRIAVKVINHLGDEVMKVFKV
ncbi:site-specific DNA-methyltransferase [Leptospira sp. GIMC2001]|uniref:site-specific DNA-methyltransferase n=1 Tax=Leptospira sp. GIMC2001 TaxID=1513297 RepID=UPI00234B7B73|nr:site-specific DNA-methyltransferase [Leptospira sp. GIMC2001]WCL50752.1 site-specific DNA-methyltransferase [Leptospira sp. GIMC2001]